MQFDEAQRRRERWAAGGNPPCPHAVVVEEFALGNKTGDEVCVRCGATMSTPAGPVAPPP